ncbi:MAG: hypothetical protein GY835_01320 [bacterium]|nr:hypothetical protein [bacterium]
MKSCVFHLLILFLIYISLPLGHVTAGEARIDKARRLAEKKRLAGEAERVPVPLALFELYPDLRSEHTLVVSAVRWASEARRKRLPIRGRIDALEIALRLRESFTKRLVELARDIDGSVERMERVLQMQLTLIEEIKQIIEKERLQKSALEKLPVWLRAFEDVAADPLSSLPDLPISEYVNEEIRNGLEARWARVQEGSRPDYRQLHYRRLRTDIERYLALSRQAIDEFRRDIEKVRDVGEQSKDSVMVQLGPLLDQCIRENVLVNVQYRSLLRDLRERL